MNKLSELLRKADALKTAAEMRGGWSEEDAKLCESLLADAEKEKKSVEMVARIDAIKAWSEKPDGQSVVKAGFAGEALPDEGKIPGVTADMKAADSELYAYSKLGAATLAALKSGEYKDAYRDYIVLSTRYGAEWRSQMKGGAMKVLQEGSDPAGGFWAPPDLRAEVIRKMAVSATIRPNAYVFTTGTDMVSFPKVTYTTDNLWSSGVRFGWTAEAPSAAISESTNPVAGRINIPVFTATAAIIVTRALVEDGQFDILGYASDLIGEAFALGEEDAFISGDGVGKPQGITKHTNATVAHASGGMYVVSGSSGAVTWGGTTATALDSTKGLMGVEAALPPQYENGARWYFSKSTKAAIRALTDQNGRPQWQSGDVYPSMANGYQASLLGFPYTQTQFMPVLASDSLSVMYGNLKGYYIPDRVGMSIQVFNEIRGLQDEIVLYARKRMGGYLVHDWKVKLLKAGTS